MVMALNHEFYIRRTFELALKARGMVSPNPLVGCVVVKNEKVLAEGFHRGPGEFHAEPDALKSLSHEDVAGSTLYCNLEPCCHTGKRTPPCTSLLLDKKPARVVISNLDPNPQVSGKGVQILKDAGIEVITGVLEEEGQKLNEVFFKNIVTQKPFVHLKVAQTLDGKMVSSTGSSQWITDEKARTIVHQWRNDVDAVLIGGPTASIDNPALTPRMANVQNKKCPMRIVLSESELDSKLALFTDEFRDQTIVLKTHDLSYALSEISKLGITSILVEAGPKLAASFIDANLVDRLSIFIAPKILGNGSGFYQNDKITDMNEAMRLKEISYEIVGDQILISGTF